MGRIKAYLHECPLDFTIRTCTLGEPATTDSVDLVHENDARFVFARIPEHLAHHSGGLSDVLVDDRTGHDLEEVGVQCRSDGTCEEGLARSRRAIEEDTFRWLDANSKEKFRVEERKFDNLKDATGSCQFP